MGLLPGEMMQKAGRRTDLPVMRQTRGQAGKDQAGPVIPKEARADLPRNQEMQQQDRRDLHQAKDQTGKVAYSREVE